MFFNKNVTNVRRASAAGGTLSPRFARLIRESWWLLAVAVFVYLGLILASYTRTDPGWSFSGTGDPLGNRGGAVGAWLADLLLYLFGLSAWWLVIGGMVLVVAGFRRIVRPDDERDHPFALGYGGHRVDASGATAALAAAGRAVTRSTSGSDHEPVTR